MTLEYTFSLTDKLSAGLQKIIINNERMLDTFGGVQMKMLDVNYSFNDTGKSITSLKKRAEFLQEERELIPAGNTKAIIGYNNEINKLNSEIEKLENLKEVPWTEQLESLIPGLEKAFNPMNMLSSAAGSLKQTISDGLTAWKSQYEEQERLSVVMHNTMNAGDEEVKSILKLTDAQQKMGVVSQQTQIAGVEALAGNVSQHDSLQRMIPLMNDMIARQYGVNASKEKATEIAGAFGKIMQGETNALSQYKIELTEAQKGRIRLGDETARVAMLEEVVGKAVGGANLALAQTPEGRWQQHENGISALSGRIGKLTVQFRNALFPVINTFSGLFEKLVSWIESHSTAISSAINNVCAVIAPVLETVFAFISIIGERFAWWFNALTEGNPLIVGITANITGLVATLGGLYAITKAVTFCQNVLSGATKLLSIAQLALNSAYLTSPLTWIVLAIGAVVTVVMICWNKFEGFRRVVLGVWNVVKEFGKSLFNAVLEPIKKIINGIGILGKAISQLFNGDMDGAWESAKAGAAELMEGVKGADPRVVGINVAKTLDIEGAWQQGEEDAKNGVGLFDMEMPSLPGLSDMLNFGGVGAAAGVGADLVSLQPSPAALGVQPQMESGLTIQPSIQPGIQPVGITESYQGFTQPQTEGKTIYVENICEQIVIHVANTDRQGTEEIKSAIYEVLNEIAEA